MDFQRPILIAAIAAVSLMLLVEWNKFQQAEKPAQANAEQIAPEISAPVDVPTASSNNADTPVAPESAVAPVAPVVNAMAAGKIIDVYSDKLHLKIDTDGGDIVMAALRDYPAKINEPEHPFVVLTRTNTNLYIAQSGLIGDNGIDKGAVRPRFIAPQVRYDMADNAQILVVDLPLADNSGANIVKRYTLHRGEHWIDVSYVVKNTTQQPWSGYFYGQIKRDTHEPVSTGGGVGIRPFLGGAITTPEKHYQKMSFKDMAKTPLKENILGGWIAMVQHYFVSAWIPSATK